MEIEQNKEELALLVEKAENDPEHFEKLYNYFFPKIYNYIYYRVNDRLLAEDLVSDIFIKVINNISNCKNKKQFQSWLFTIARNHLIDFYRKNKTRHENEASENQLDSYYQYTLKTNYKYDNPETTLVQKLDQEEISKLIKNLSPQQQDVIILRFFEELKLKEIAEIMNKNEGAVKGLLYRGIKALTAELQKRGVIS